MNSNIPFRNNKIYHIWKYLLLVLLLWILSIIIINIFVLSFSKTWHYRQVNDLEQNYIGLVFWAAVKWKNTPSDILKDRLNVAYDAYIKNKIDKIIVSGDNSDTHYNEPVAMQKYLLGLWVPVDDIYLDYAGFDTYDSIYRAKEIFGAEKLTLFTQDFHLKRAMYIAKRFDIETIGIETNLQKYRKEKYNNRREVFARIKAFLEVEIFKTKPKFLWESIEIITDEKIGEAKKNLIQ